VETKRKRVALALGLILAAGACGTDEGGLGRSSDNARRSSPNVGEVVAERGAPPPTPTTTMTAPAPATTTPTPAPATTPPATTTPPPANPSNATVIIRAEKIAARRIVARLIYAEKIEAESTAVADLRRDDGKLWETQGAKNVELSFDELRADTIYTKEIKAEQVEAAEAYVKDLKILGSQPPRNGEEAEEDD
jgi:hypothetical protein